MSADPLRFLHLTDLHLSDVTGTAAARSLEWVISLSKECRPDFVAVSGDMTTFGTAGSAQHLQRALDEIEVPVLFTPGNAELRSGSLGPLERLCTPERRMRVHGDLLVLLPDTSSGALPEHERAWMEQAAQAHPKACRQVLITHYPTDRLAEACRVWLMRYVRDRNVELFVAGHTHRHCHRHHNGCLEVVSRGLDPDKAIGAPPGVSLFE
ncbi:MAG: metallophosphoesterase, partial [Candidatus Latescibacteria bacterium]|nr:metallophosphoesterase [Candidatus Latescibacterota bacterium]